MTKNFIILYALGLAISACCTKKYCEGKRYLDPRFYGFSTEEMDSVYVTGYKPGTGFTQVIRPEELDTVMRNGSDSSLIVVSRDRNNYIPLPDSCEWKLYIPAVNRTILLSDYTYNSFSCNNCPIEKEDKITSMSTCKIDGVVTGVGDIRVER